MKIIYRLSGLTDADSEMLTRRVEKKKSKLTRVTGRAKGEAVVLRVNARKSGRPEVTRVSLSLSLRRGVLFTERSDSDPSAALDRALDALTEEIRTFRSSVFQERQRRRHRRVAEELLQAQAYLEERARRSDRASFDERLRPLLRLLYTLAVSEVRDRQVAGDLPLGAVDPVEVLDEVVARTYEAFRSDGIDPPLKTWLVSTMNTYLDEVQDTHRAEPTVASPVHLEESLPHDDPLDVRSLGDDQLEFYQPDESLHLEDVLPDLALADPVEALSAREQMRYVYRALRQLPRRQRQAFLLHADGFDDMEIAMIQNRSEKEVGQDIRAVREIILNQLESAS